MVITSTTLRSLHAVAHRPVKQLTLSDLPALKHLYTQHPESGFSADFFTQGLYFGAYAGERIIAAGGTHALVPAYQIAVLGNILESRDTQKI